MDINPDIFDSRMTVPGSAAVYGSSMSGKTNLVFDWIKNAHLAFDRNFSKIYYIYGIYSPKFDQFREERPDIIFTDDYRDISDSEDGEPILCIYDDKQLDFESNIDERNHMHDVLFRSIHHKTRFCVFICQSLFSKKLRQAFLNIKYHIIFPNGRDSKILKYLNSQMFPGHPSYLSDSMEHSSKEPYGYLFLNCSANVHSNFRVTNFVVPKKSACCYLPKNVENSRVSRVSTSIGQQQNSRKEETY